MSRSDDYYDRKVAKAEETAMLALKYGLLLGIAITLLTMFWSLFAPTERRQAELEIHDCYEQGKRAVMLTDGTIQCRETSNGMDTE
jgi:hypothetical protein